MDTNDPRDTYYFDALTVGNIEVTMENTDNNSNEFNWLAYSSDNTNNYIGYATKREGNKIIGNFKVDKPGRYYIVAYKTSSNKINYKLNIKGDIDNVPKMMKFMKRKAMILLKLLIKLCLILPY
ncbi:PPC domain-containing protein [Clostridium botulinum]|nr:PPC domain-containing protein [Clostridium botulinum]